MGACLSYDSWGVSWGNSWGSSWLHGDAPTPPPPDTAEPIVGGGIPARSRLTLRDWRTKDEIRLDRERFGLSDKASRVVALVAERQADRLEQDEQKRFDELLRELQLRELEWDARYLDALNVQRQRLIDAEIAARLLQMMDDEMVVLMLLAAAV